MYPGLSLEINSASDDKFLDILFVLRFLFSFIVVVFCVLVVFGRLGLMKNRTNFSSKLLIVNLSKPSLPLLRRTLVYVRECLQMGLRHRLDFLCIWEASRKLV